MDLYPSSMTLVAFLLLVSWNVLFASAQPGASDALLSFRHAVGDSPVLRSWKGDPCSLPSWRGVGCSGMHRVTSLKLPNFGLTGFISPAIENLTSLVSLWLDGNHLVGPIPPGLGHLKNLTSLRLSRNKLNGGIPESLLSASKLQELFLDGNQLTGVLPFLEIPSQMTIKVSGNADLCSPSGASNLSTCAPALAPALVLGPGEGVPLYHKSKHPSHAGAIAGGVAGAVVLVAISIGLVSICLLKMRKRPAAGSETGSSDPSAQVDWPKAPGSPLHGVVAAIVGAQQAVQYSYEELDHATKSFKDTNLVGKGRFGFVYKGLLEDGTIVAIKTRSGPPSEDFVNQALNLAQFRHKHLVSLLGFCQEHQRQMLVYDYVPNGSLSNHLYDSNGVPVGTLDFKQRVSIALGAARGLEYLHSGGPSSVHQDFKTSNVLLGENLAAKVTDFGLTRLLLTSQSAMSSVNGAGTHGFMDPALNSQQHLNQLSDVYSFGVFLLELISDRNPSTYANGNIVDWARSWMSNEQLDAMVSSSLFPSITREEDCRRLVLLALGCTDDLPEKRPKMKQVTETLEEILDKERDAAADGNTVVTLGSELFKGKADKR